MAEVPEGKFRCTGCKNVYAEEEEDDDGNKNADFSIIFYCDECDGDQENPYCTNCILYFDNDAIGANETSYCQSCLDAAMKEAKNLKGHVVERVVEKPVEKIVYVKENVYGREDTDERTSSSEESMEEFEKRILSL